MTNRYAVIGRPIGHTKSPLIHRAFAAATGHAIEYDAIEGMVGGFAAAVDGFRAAGGLGLNVTTPFKLDAFGYATELRQPARLAGAVNAIKFEGGRVIADNFDGIGLVNDIQRNLGFAMTGRRVLMLGAGGAVRGALHPFLAQGPAVLVVANRTVDKARALAREFDAHGAVLAAGYDELAGLGGFDLVVNGTSTSLHGEAPPVGAGSFGASCLAYDLSYGRGLTPFLRVARAAEAARLEDGVGMLVEQAAEAFAWWRGVRPHTAGLIEQLRVPLR